MKRHIPLVWRKENVYWTKVRKRESVNPIQEEIANKMTEYVHQGHSYSVTRVKMVAYDILSSITKTVFTAALSYVHLSFQGTLIQILVATQT